jgi:hypothetical protein
MTTATATATATVNLRGFAQDVLIACHNVPDHALFGRKAFVHHVWAMGRFEVSLAEFKALLIEANRLGHLMLSRCDLVEAFDAHDVKRSTVSHMGATFNFIRF